MMRVLETYFERMLDIAREDDAVLLFNYKQGMEEVTSMLAKKCSIPLSIEWKEKMRERAGYHGKFPGEKFVEANRDMERIPISSRLEAAYAELERRRMKILG
jgi:hypothetical protein